MSHASKKFRTRSMEKQGGMAFGFRKTATAVIKPEELDNHQVNGKFFINLYLYE
jgi:hypothetical protein